MFKFGVLVFVFLSGLGGNLISQAVRGIGNLINGFFCSTSGILMALISFIQWFGGGGKQAKKTFSTSKNSLFSGLVSLVSGAFQLALSLTLVSPVIRGSQIISEPLFSVNGIYAPAGKNRTWLQILLGLNSWRNDSLVKPLQKFEFSAPIQTQTPVFAEISPVIVNVSKPKNKRQEKAPDTNLKKLVMLYKDSRTRFRNGVKTGPKEILTSIALRYPRYYQTQIDRSLKKKRKSASR